MDAGGFSADHQDMYQLGGRIRSTARALGARVSSLQGALSPPGQSAGNDQVGSLICACYEAISQFAMRSYSANIAALDEMGQRVQIAAGGYGDAGNADIASANTIAGS
ncbi:MAG: hypothetical protein ACRDNZ_12055 [Streptosporangiaceae bacterium]